MTGEVIVVEGLSKRFGDRTALQDLTFSAHPGEIVGLLGPNGAGKTTTIRLLSTILAPSAGAYRIAGIPHTDPVGVRRHIGVLPESFGFHGHQTGREHLIFFGRLYGYDRQAATGLAEALLGEVALAERAHTPIASYSRGMRQRLGIARALLSHPTAVLLDEPSLGLDPAGHRQLTTMIGDLAARRGATVLLSTHSLADVEQLCTRVVILASGRMIRSGTVAEVTASVAAPRSAQLRVDPAAVAQVRTALPAGCDVAIDPQQPGGLRVTPSPGQRPCDLLPAILSAGIEVYAFEVDTPRLTDAFFAATGGALNLEVPT